MLFIFLKINVRNNFAPDTYRCYSYGGSKCSEVFSKQSILIEIDFYWSKERPTEHHLH